MESRTSFALVGAAILVTFAVAVPVQAGPNKVDYTVPFWDDTQTDEFGRYTHSDGGQWFIGRRTNNANLYHYPLDHNITPPLPFSISQVGPTYKTPSPVGDINGNGQVDIEDFGIFAADFGQEIPQALGLGPPADASRSDLNNDLVVDIEDFGLFAAHFGETGSPQWSWLKPDEHGGNARFTGELKLETDMVVNQFPGIVLIFQAPADGDYSIKGKARWDWHRSNHPDDDPANTGVPDPAQISQMRFEISTWTAENNVFSQTHPLFGDLGTSPDRPGSGRFGNNELYDCDGNQAGCGDTLEQLIHVGDLRDNHGLDQATGTFTLDLATVDQIQNIPLKKDDFLSIQSRNRGLLSLARFPDPELILENLVFDNLVMDLALDPADPVRIQGSSSSAAPSVATPEPTALVVLGLGGLLMTRRHRAFAR